MKELCIPESAVAIAEGESGSVAPQPGDMVEATIAGPVTRAEGGNIYFEARTANGEPIPDMGPAKPLDEDAAMDREMAAYGEGPQEALYG